MSWRDLEPMDLSERGLRLVVLGMVVLLLMSFVEKFSCRWESRPSTEEKRP